MSKWMDINTAPKDRRILLAYGSGFVEAGRCLNSRRSNSGVFIGDSVKCAVDDPIAWQELPVFEGVISE